MTSKHPTRALFALGCATLLLATGCGTIARVTRAVSRAAESSAAATPSASDATAPTSASDDEKSTISVASEDADINRAITQAKSTFGTFSGALNTDGADRDAFAVKIAFEADADSGSESEHIWLSDVRVSGDKITGLINNEPEYIARLSMGDEVTVDVADLSDWYYIQDGKMIGGYSIRVFRDRMSAEERAQFDSGLGFRID
jgi:uncharacterized protein YegJ (DUF2314 family)